jgi:hypothetical protein
MIFHFSHPAATKRLISYLGEKMRVCPERSSIDDYLLNRMDESERTGFEQHYFDCASCFQALEKRDLVLRAVKAAGSPVLAVPFESPISRGRRLFRPWMAAAAGALLLAGVLLGPGLLRKPAVWIPPTNDAVRGGTIEAVAPVGGTPAAPAALEWRPLGEGVEYAVTLSGPGVDWSGRTRETRIALPAPVRDGLRPDTDYRWQVKAFAPQGFFMGTSGPQRFRIGR